MLRDSLYFCCKELLEWCFNHENGYLNTKIKDICFDRLNNIQERGFRLGDAIILKCIQKTYSQDYPYSRILYSCIGYNNICPGILDWLLSDDILYYFENVCDWEIVKNLYCASPFKYYDEMKKLSGIISRHIYFDDVFSNNVIKFDVDVNTNLLIYGKKCITINNMSINNKGYCISKYGGKVRASGFSVRYAEGYDVRYNDDNYDKIDIDNGIYVSRNNYYIDKYHYDKKYECVDNNNLDIDDFDYYW